jgi:hypothetical protein
MLRQLLSHHRVRVALLALFRKKTNGNFSRMEEKYGSISDEMKKMRTTFEKLVDS